MDLNLVTKKDSHRSKNFFHVIADTFKERTLLPKQVALIMKDPMLITQGTDLH